MAFQPLYYAPLGNGSIRDIRYRISPPLFSFELRCRLDPVLFLSTTLAISVLLLVLLMLCGWAEQGEFCRSTTADIQDLIELDAT